MMANKKLEVAQDTEQAWQHPIKIDIIDRQNTIKVTMGKDRYYFDGHKIINMCLDEIEKQVLKENAIKPPTPLEWTPASSTPDDGRAVLCLLSNGTRCVGDYHAKKELVFDQGNPYWSEPWSRVDWWLYADDEVSDA